MCISPEAGSEINIRITPPILSSPIDTWFDIDAYQPEVEAGAESEVIPGIESGVESRYQLIGQLPGESRVINAQIGSLSMEFICLSQVIGDMKYPKAIQITANYPYSRVFFINITSTIE
jgi:hypothetical protein